MNALAISATGAFGVLAGWQASSPRMLGTFRMYPSWPTVRLLVCLSSGILSVALIWKVPTLFAVVAYSLFSAALLIAGLVDLTDLRIPRKLVLDVSALGAVLLAAASATSHRWDRAGNAALGAVLILAVFFALHLASRGSLGFGDVRLAGMCGEYLGWLGLREAFFGLAFALVFAGLSAAILLGAGLVKRSSRIPLGPFITLGALVAMLSS